MWPKLLIIISLHQLAAGQAPNVPILDQDYWNKDGLNELHDALKVKLNTGVARNVIIFIGDGMSPDTITASRIYRAGETSRLVWEEFDHVGLLKTYSTDKQVPDSASTATSLLTGVKGNFYTMGLDQSVKVNDCSTSLKREARIPGVAIWAQDEGKATVQTYSNDATVPDSATTATAIMTGIKGNRLTLGTDGFVKSDHCAASLNPFSRTKSNAQVAQEEGKSTGFVTTTRVTHATPGAVYAHSAQRNWECDTELPETAKDCKDIARQLMEDEPGRSLNVIMGGGRQCLVPVPVSYPNDTVDSDACVRSDSRHLINEWITRQDSSNSAYAYVNNTGSLRDLDSSKVDNLLGIFGNSHLAYNYQRDLSDKGSPSLELMATTAVKILSKNPKGFLLLVEGGKIDLAHHKGRAKVALDETIELNKAVNATIKLLESMNILDETLLIVTSDHCHTMSINGYPERGSSILGIADPSEEDGTNYTTLLYTTSTQENFQFEVVDGKVKRRDPSRDDTESWDYHQQALVLNDEAKHGGGDVAVYAIGPMSHLFHRVHEQSYVAHVVQYAAQMGRYKNRNIVSSSSQYIASCILVLLSIVGLGYL